jgi:hypothetical protein
VNMKKEKRPKNKLDHKYVFPNFLASAMKNTDVKTQLRAAMLSMLLLLIGMILMSVYTIIYLQQGWIFKGLILFNVAAGFLFMTSYLVTTFQQYVSYMAAIEVQGIMEGLNQYNPANQYQDPPVKKNRVNQVLFFGGWVLIIIAIILYFTLANNKTNHIIESVMAIIGFLMMISIFFRRKKKVKDEPVLQSPVVPKWSQELDELKEQEEIDRIETGVDQYVQEEPAEQEEYKTRRFYGRDGKIYFQ